MAVCWGFGGDMWMPQRIAFVSDVLPLLGSIAQPPTDGETTLLDYEVRCWRVNLTEVCRTVSRHRERLRVCDAPPDDIRVRCKLVSGVD